MNYYLNNYRHTKAGVSAPYISQLAAKYFAGGIETIAGNHYGENRSEMSVEEEAVLKPFYETAEYGEIIEVSEIKQAYQEKVDHKISSGQIYYVLRRHG